MVIITRMIPTMVDNLKWLDPYANGCPGFTLLPTISIACLHSAAINKNPAPYRNDDMPS